MSAVLLQNTWCHRLLLFTLQTVGQARTEQSWRKTFLTLVLHAVTGHPIDQQGLVDSKLWPPNRSLGDAIANCVLPYGATGHSQHWQSPDSI